jgi:hypothetical protein
MKKETMFDFFQIRFCFNSCYASAEINEAGLGAGKKPDYPEVNPDFEAILQPYILLAVFRII